MSPSAGQSTIAQGFIHSFVYLLLFLFVSKQLPKRRAEKSRRVKVFDVRAAATEPLTWAELTASQSAEMALGHTEFGTCQLPSLSGRVGLS